MFHASRRESIADSTINFTVHERIFLTVTSNTLSHERIISDIYTPQTIHIAHTIALIWDVLCGVFTLLLSPLTLKIYDTKIPEKNFNDNPFFSSCSSPSFPKNTFVLLQDYPPKSPGSNNVGVSTSWSGSRTTVSVALISLLARMITAAAQCFHKLIHTHRIASVHQFLPRHNSLYSLGALSRLLSPNVFPLTDLLILQKLSIEYI